MAETPEAGPPAPTPTRTWPLQAFLAGLVAVSLAVAATAVLYSRSQALRDARESAARSAAFSAHLGAREIGTDLTLLQTTVGQTAANPGVVGGFERPQGCSLNFVGTVFTSGHLDLVASDGSVLCTSLPRSSRPVSYAGSAWLVQGADGPAMAGPLVDVATGKHVVVASAPVPGHGVVAGFVDLEGLGQGLTNLFGGPDRLEFLVTTGDRSTALTRSGDAGRWTGTPLAGTPFAVARGSVERPDVDGTARIYGEAPVEGVGWEVYAGADRAAALAAARGLFHRGLFLILVGLLLSLSATFVVHRRIARPIRDLSRAVRGVDVGRFPAESTEVHDVRGPAEVARLVADFNGLLTAVSRELAGRLRAEEAAQAADLAYRLVFEGSPLPMWIHDRETLLFLEVNRAAVGRYGYTREEFLAMTTDDVLGPDEVEEVQRSLAAGRTRERSGPWPHLNKDQTVILTRTTSHDVTFEGRPARFALVEDVTETERLEHQLRQAQRLESLGHLAGGVAHDFNNLLGVILNYAWLVGEELEAATTRDGGDRWAQAGQDVGQIQRAAERAVDLTRQLLSFARREVVQTSVLLLNDVVANLGDILRRTLGEHVLLRTSLAEDLWPVRADPGRLEQVLFNLTVNARDAMSGGGALTIETKNIDVDEAYAGTRPALTPGPYVELTVSDTGTGIEADVLQHVFEPFFTTKAKGEGTGLGLATAYGIVLQAGGDISVYTEPGIGTTFRVLLPAVEGELTEARRPSGPHLRQGGETVLVVEDEDALREVTERILARNGYQVISAPNGPEALELLRAHAGKIHLVLTDVVMPHMLGKELAQRIREVRPGIRVLFMSGYAQPILGPTGNLEAGAVLLEKPFTEASLLEKVGDLLDAAPP